MDIIRKPTLFYQALFVSLALHCSILWLLYQHPFILHPLNSFLIKRFSSTTVVPLYDEDINLSEKNIALEQSLNRIVVLDRTNLAPLDIHLQPYPAVFFPTHEELQINNEFTPASHTFPIDIEMLPKTIASDSQFSASASRDMPIESIFSAPPLIESSFPDATDLPLTFALPSLQSQQLLEEINTPTYTPSKEVVLQNPMILAKPLTLPTIDTDIARIEPEPTIISDSIPNESFSFTTTPQEAAEFSYTLPSLQSYQLPPIANLFDWSEAFTVSVKTTVMENGKHLFAATFQTKKSFQDHKMKQNYYFCIDRSNSIKKYVYNTFKRGVARALKSIPPDSNFNILIFDRKSVAFSPTPLPCTKKTIQAALQFLQEQEHGTYFAAAELYRHLSKLMPQSLNEEEAHTAILLSDGHSSLKPEKKHLLIQKWMQEKPSQLHVYTAAIGKNNNKTMLNLLATLSGGSFFESNTHAAFPRKLAKVILDVSNPILKDISLTTSIDCQLYPMANHMPDLYSNRPFTVYGVVDTPTDLTINLQGRNRQEVVSIKKQISWPTDHPASQTAELLSFNAHLQSMQYLETGGDLYLGKPQR